MVVFFLYHVQNKDSIHVADVAHTSSSGGLNALQLIRCLCGESTHTLSFLLLFAVCEVRKCQFVVSDMEMKRELLTVWTHSLTR